LFNTRILPRKINEIQGKSEDHVMLPEMTQIEIIIASMQRHKGNI